MRRKKHLKVIRIMDEKRQQDQLLLSISVDRTASMSIKASTAMPRTASVDCFCFLNMCMHSFV